MRGPATDDVVFGNAFGYTGGTAPPMMYGQYGEMIQAQPQYQEMIPMQVIPSYVAQAEPTPSPEPEQTSIVLPPAPRPPAPVPQKAQPDQVTIPIEEPRKETISPPITATPPAIVQAETIDPCCTTPVSLACFGFVGASFFIFFTTITSVMVFSSSRDFCNGYWKTQKDPSMQYQFSGLSAVAVWAFIMGSTVLVLGLLWFLENRAATFQMRAARDQIRTLLVFGSLFGLAWLVCGNIWVIGRTSNTYLGIEVFTGKIPEDCKLGNMGDNSFFWFCYIIIIILDALAPLAMAYAFVRTFLNKTFAG